MISISIVIPLFNEEKNIEELYLKIKEVLVHINKRYEIIFIDDASTDKTYDIIKDIQINDKNIRIERNKRNLGQSHALLYGFSLACGKFVIVMDGDLQNDPCDIPKFLEKIDEGFDFINGWRYNRSDTLVRKLISKISNWIIGKKTGVGLHDYGCAFVVVNRKLIDKLLTYGERARFIKPILAKLSISPIEIKVKHNPRRYDRSRYNLIKLIKIGWDFIFNFNF